MLFFIIEIIFPSGKQVPLASSEFYKDSRTRRALILDALEALRASTGETRLESTLIFAHGHSPLDQFWSAHEIQNAVALDPSLPGGGESELEKAKLRGPMGVGAN